MGSVKSIKSQLAFVKDMQKLIQALKDIDGTHFQKLSKEKNNQFEEYDRIVGQHMRLFSKVLERGNVDDSLVKSKCPTVGIIVLSSDASFMGKLNTYLCREAVNLCEQVKDFTLLIFGKKGLVRLKNLDGEIIAFPTINDETRYQQVIALRDFVLERRAAGKMGDLYIIAARCQSFTNQDVECVRLLPPENFLQEKMDIKLEPWQELCVESSVEAIHDFLIQNWLVQKLYDYAYESKLAQYAARTTHLEGSLDYLSDQIKKLALQYNKAKGEATDKGMRETFASLMG